MEVAPTVSPVNLLMPITIFTALAHLKNMLFPATGLVNHKLEQPCMLLVADTTDILDLLGATLIKATGQGPAL